MRRIEPFACTCTCRPDGLAIWRGQTADIAFPPDGSTCFDLQPWSSKIASFTLEYAIHRQILKDAPFLHMLSGTAFVGHAKFLHHPSRSRIARQMCGIDAVQPEHLEAIAHHRP